MSRKRHSRRRRGKTSTLNADLLEDEDDNVIHRGQVVSPDSHWQELRFRYYLRMRMRNGIKAKNSMWVDGLGRPVTLAERILRFRVEQEKIEESGGTANNMDVLHDQGWETGSQDKPRLQDLLEEYTKMREREEAISNGLLQHLSQVKTELRHDDHLQVYSASARRQSCSSISLGDSATHINAKARIKGSGKISTEVTPINSGRLDIRKGVEDQNQSGYLPFSSGSRAPGRSETAIATASSSRHRPDSGSREIGPMDIDKLMTKRRISVLSARFRKPELQENGSEIKDLDHVESGQNAGEDEHDEASSCHAQSPDISLDKELAGMMSDDISCKSSLKEQVDGQGSLQSAPNDVVKESGETSPLTKQQQSDKPISPRSASRDSARSVNGSVPDIATSAENDVVNNSQVGGVEQDEITNAEITKVNFDIEVEDSPSNMASRNNATEGEIIQKSDSPVSSHENAEGDFDNNVEKKTFKNASRKSSRKEYLGNNSGICLNSEEVAEKNFNNEVERNPPDGTSRSSLIMDDHDHGQNNMHISSEQTAAQISEVLTPLEPSLCFSKVEIKTDEPERSMPGDEMGQPIRVSKLEANLSSPRLSMEGVRKFPASGKLEKTEHKCKPGDVENVCKVENSEQDISDLMGFGAERTYVLSDLRPQQNVKLPSHRFQFVMGREKDVVKEIPAKITGPSSARCQKRHEQKKLFLPSANFNQSGTIDNEGEQSRDISAGQSRQSIPVRSQSQRLPHISTTSQKLRQVTFEDPAPTYTLPMLKNISARRTSRHGYRPRSFARKIEENITETAVPFLDRLSRSENVVENSKTTQGNRIVNLYKTLRGNRTLGTESLNISTVTTQHAMRTDTDSQFPETPQQEISAVTKNMKSTRKSSVLQHCDTVSYNHISLSDIMETPWDNPDRTINEYTSPFPTALTLETSSTKGHDFIYLRDVSLSRFVQQVSESHETTQYLRPVCASNKPTGSTEDTGIEGQYRLLGRTYRKLPRIAPFQGRSNQYRVHSRHLRCLDIGWIQDPGRLTGNSPRTLRTYNARETTMSKKRFQVLEKLKKRVRLPPIKNS